MDDDQLTARSMQATLEKRGFTVVGVACGPEDAKNQVKDNRADLALLDVNLQGQLSGIDLAVYLKEKYGIPSVFITGYSEDALIDKARRARPVGFIRKPFSDVELAACVEAVSERCLSRERLTNHLPGLRAVADQLHQAVIASDLEGQVVMMNQPAETLTGWSKEEACDIRIREVAPLDESTSSEGEREIFLTDKEGQRVQVEERSTPIRSSDGDVIGLVSVFDRVGEMEVPTARASALQKVAALTDDPAYRNMLSPKAKEALDERESEEAPEREEPTESPADPLLKMTSPLVEDLGDPLITFEPDGDITYANSEACNMFAKGKSLQGSKFSEVFSAADYERAESEFASPLIDGKRHRFEFQDSQRSRWYEVRLYRSGEGILGLFHDISSRKLAEAENVRQQRLEGLGLLARGFAHDFNNHLTTITGNLNLARDKYTSDEDLQSMLGEADAAANRASELVQQLMTFASGGKPIRENVRVPDLLRRILSEHRVRFPHIRYQFQPNETNLVAFIDPAQFSRLVDNLISNSENAMRHQAGALVVRCGKVAPEEIQRFVRGRQPLNTEHLLVEVIDTGPGMDTDTLNQVFEPYFTTRKTDNATGIGLTVCESIARAHGGFIFLQSKQGKGTIATFCCPINDVSLEPDSDEAPTSQLPAAPVKQLGGDESEADEERKPIQARILLLEDDEPILKLMSKTLQRSGHTVVETRDGRDTVSEYRLALEDNQPFDLVISDLTIEHGVGGVETMRKLREMDPKVLAIVSSGYSDDTAMSNPDRYGFSAVLPKPYAPQELRDLVDRVLAKHAALAE